MRLPKPRFELKDVYTDGSSGPAEIVPVTSLPWETRMERRGLLGAGVAFSSAMLLMRREAAGAQTGSPTEIHFAHLRDVKALDIRSDGETVASISSDDTLKMWSLSSFSTSGFVESAGFIYTGVGFAGGDLISVGSAGVQIHGGSTTLPIQTDPGSTPYQFSNHASAMAISPRGDSVAYAPFSSRYYVRLARFPQGQTIREIDGHKQQISALAFTPDGSTLASGSRDTTIKVWSYANGSLLATLSGHRDVIQSLAVSPDGQTLASASRDNTIRLWALPSGRPLRTIQGHSRGRGVLSYRGVTSVAFSPDGNTLISGGGDQVLRLWSVLNGSPAGEMQGHRGVVTCLRISNNWTCVSGDANGSILVWDLASQRLRGSLFDPEINTRSSGIYSLPDGSGRPVTYSQSCGAPVPAGAICTCNCVAGTYVVPTATGSGSTGGGSGGSRGCSCNPVCICVPIF